jgi:general secretion pathway protein L
VTGFGEVANPSDYPLDDEDEVIGVVSGGSVTVHSLTLPTKSRRQFMTAVPFALEDAVADDIDALHFVCPDWQAGATNLVYVVSCENMQDWQSLATACQLPLDRMVPDYSLLPLHDVADSTLCRLEALSSLGAEQVITHQRNGSGTTLDKDFIDIWMSDIDVKSTIAVTDRALTEELIERYPDRDFRLWEIGSRMAHWLEHTAGNPHLDLMGDRFRPNVRKVEWLHYKLPATLILAAVSLVLLFDVYRYFSLHQEIRSTLDQQVAILQDTFPDIENVPEGSARMLMERALRNRVGVAPSHTATSMLAVTARVLQQQGVSLSEVAFRDGKLLITCVLNDLSQVDQITRSLNAKSKITAQLESSANDDGLIFASYVLEAQT